MSSHVCLADSSSALPVIPQPIEWLSGPLDTSLAGHAEIHVPAGYRFTDTKGARVLLESARSPVPEDLTGLIAPVAGDWWITLAYREIGHVEITERDHLDAEGLLKAFWSDKAAERKGRAMPALSHINWIMAPSYHSSWECLDCAIRLEGFTPQDQKVAYISYILGRRGVIEAKGVRTWRDGEDGAAFVQAVRGIAFKTGQKHTDFQSGEKVASAKLGDLIASTHKIASVSGSNSISAVTGGMRLFWIGFAAIGCIGFSGVVLIAKALRRTKPANTAPHEVHVSAAAPAPRPTAILTPKLVHTNGKPKPALKPANGNGHAAPQRNGVNGKKRRMFNYHKFYTEMVLQGPAPVIGESLNGHNGHNGHDHDASRNDRERNGNGSSESSAAMRSAHSEIIASQRSLIEEQKRLIQEQARLIEEKSKVISEKTQLLDRQSQMIDNNLL